MRRQHLVLLAIATVIAASAVRAGAPPATALVVVLVPGYPILMLFMTRSMTASTPTAIT
ncbi:hypothetical protein [Microtetraspora malaysiensis]|uniref:Uncharacterized protein n=1 Tax=Microtetraspora malaysiensis TaxID=161358 RepID=A0ABW6SQB1_9ACTN